MTKAGDTDSLRRAATDDGLLAQHKLLVAVIATDWATRLDHKVASVIIERFMRRRGNARVSLRYLERATRSSRTNIVVSIRRLCLNGVFNVIREGLGSRPTEYGLNFDFATSGHAGDTTSVDSSSGHVGVTSCGHVDDTTTDASGHVGVTESSLTVPGLQAGVHEREIDCAAPTAPQPVAGLTAAPAAGTAQGGFDEVYIAYGYKRNRADARVAYEAIDPDEDLHQQIVAAALEWREAWEAQNKPDAPRKHLASWLKAECYLEDPPSAYKAKERKPKAERPKPEPPRPSNPDGGEVVTIAGVETTGSPFTEFGCELDVTGPGGVRTFTLSLLHENGEVGKDLPAFNAMQEAFGQDGSEWVGAKIRIVTSGDAITSLTPVAPRPEPFVERRETLIVISAELDKCKDDDGRPETRLHIEYRREEDGAEIEGESFILECLDGAYQERQHELFRKLRDRLGLGDVSDVDELVGASFVRVLRSKFGEWEYERPPDKPPVTPPPEPETERPAFDKAGFMQRIRRLEGPVFGSDDED